MANWKMLLVTSLWVTMMKAPSTLMMTMPWVSVSYRYATTSVMCTIIFTNPTRIRLFFINSPCRRSYQEIPF